jgi:hypothetical protein
MGEISASAVSRTKSAAEAGQEIMTDPPEETMVSLGAVEERAVVTKTAVLLVPAGSSSFPPTSVLFVRVPATVGDTKILTSALVPAGRFPRLQTRRPLAKSSFPDWE